MTFLSVILCTRNRDAQLRTALDAYRPFAGEPDWELIVVDNGSRDGTASTLRELARTSALPLRLVDEPQRGLARARNRGLAEARGDVVAFTDDDCYPAPDYLSVLRRLFDETPCDYAGGRVVLHDPSNARVSIQENPETYDIAPHAYLAPGQILGANMAFRRPRLFELRGFDERLGAGTTFRSGEDTDILRRAAAAGLSGRYAPDLVVRHHHGRTRADEAELRRGHQRGIGAVMTKFVVHSGTRHAYLRHWYWGLRRNSLRNALAQLFWGGVFLCAQGLSPERVWHHPAAVLDRRPASAGTAGGCTRV